MTGHLGELVQGRIGASGPVALITLPCRLLWAEARLSPGPLTLHAPGEAAVDIERLGRLLARLGLPLRGRFTLGGNLPPGGGAGASTAALVALARAAGAEEARIAPACLAVEGASDPLMFPAPARLLWASREGRVLRRLPALPRLEVLGGFHGPPRRTDPHDHAFPDIADLIGAWDEASRDAGALARLCTASALRTLALRGPADDPTPALARALGAEGFAIGHTGPARALLFRPGHVPPDGAARLAAAGFRGVMRFAPGEEDA